jgi:hypothetical protein
LIFLDNLLYTTNNKLLSFFVFFFITIIKNYQVLCNGSDELKNYSKLIDTYQPLKIFIGKSPLTPATIFSGGWGIQTHSSLGMSCNFYIKN